jgi:hypothetical protein
MKLRELIYDCREQFKLMSDDSNLTNFYIAYLINNARGVVMQQRYSDPRNIVPYNEYQLITLTVGQDAMTTVALPSIIKTTGNASSPIKAYTVSPLSIPVNMVSLDRLPFVGFNPFTTDMIYCALNSDGKILFNSQNEMYKLLNTINVRGLFEDPEAAWRLANPNASTDFWDAEYPISNGVLIDVRKIVDQKLAQYLNINKDTLNDATEERLDKNPQGDM